LVKHDHQVDNNPEELLAENTYNDLSQLVNKKVGSTSGSAPLQSIDYDYNIRGWMTEINKNQMAATDLGGKLFSYKIKYTSREGIENPDTAQFSGKNVVPKYNGNITEVDWRAVESIGANPSTTPKRYGYAYDKINRLTAGFYQNPQNPNSKENTESLAYDLNGNITSLYRTSVLEYGNTTPTMIDNLQYIYASGNTGNRLTNINDYAQNATGYEGGGQIIGYDVNGNMISMPDKGISVIKYNHLNLPHHLEYSRDGIEMVKLDTKYRADGTKLRKVNTTTISGINGYTTSVKTIDYLDGFQYQNITNSGGGGGGSSSFSASNLESSRAMETQAFSLVDIGGLEPVGMLKNSELQFLPTSEGFYDYIKNQYIYQYKDHLGNTRVSFGKNSAGVLEIVDANDYYPFGMNHLKSGNSFFGSSSYKNYKFQEQELQETGFYSFKWRQYMPDVARFFNIDPLAEKYPTWGPYAFSGNRIIDARELEGLEPVEINKGTKNLIIAVQGWANGNPDPGKTQVTPDKNSFSSSLMSAYGSQEGTQVAVFGASMISRTPDDISASIKAFREVSPDGKLVVVGHSLGGDNAVTAVTNTPDAKVDKLITLDISDPIGKADNSIPSNVTEAKNYYQTSNPLVGGTRVEPASGNSTTKVTNVATTDDTTHTNIDNNYRYNVVNDVKKVIPTN